MLPLTCTSHPNTGLALWFIRNVLFWCQWNIWWQIHIWTCTIWYDFLLLRMVVTSPGFLGMVMSWSHSLCYVVGGVMWCAVLCGSRCFVVCVVFQPHTTALPHCVTSDSISCRNGRFSWYNLDSNKLPCSVLLWIFIQKINLLEFLKQGFLSLVLIRILLIKLGSLHGLNLLILQCHFISLYLHIHNTGLCTYVYCTLT